jgi:predicted DNA-binding protein (MmcQ/YjbR family)
MPDFDDVRRISMALPEAEEILTWETDVTFRVRSKIFVIGGDGADHVSIKATPMAQADLVDRDPTTFAPAAYVGRFGWITVDLGRIDDAELERLIRQAWRLTAPKRLVATLEED